MAKQLVYPDGFKVVTRRETKADKNSATAHVHNITFDFTGATLVSVANKAVGQMVVDMQNEMRRGWSSGKNVYPDGNVTIKVADRLAGVGTGMVVTKESTFAYLAAMDPEERLAALREAGYIE